jgi:hypothetical protein
MCLRYVKDALECLRVNPVVARRTQNDEVNEQANDQAENAKHDCVGANIAA